MDSLRGNHPRWAWVDPCGRPCRSSSIQPSDSSGQGRLPSSVLRRLIPAHRRRSSVVVQMARRRRQQHEAAQLMHNTRPDALVLAEDQVETAAPILIQAAHKISVPCLVVPFTFATYREPAETYRDDPTHQCRGLRNRLAARRWPTWVIEYEGKRLLRLPAAGILALESLGLAPPDPWQYNSGNADAIACESDALREYLEAGGLDRSRLHVTGSASLDELAAIGSRPRADKPHRRMIVALPPDQFDVRRSFTGFESYPELLECWCRTAESSSAWEVTYSVHPRTPRSAVQAHSQSGVIADGPLTSILPGADLFVACASATIRWAIACGIPVLNYDAYRYRYDDFSRVAGVLTVESAREFRESMQRCVDDPSFLESLAQQQARQAGRWGMLDGRSGRRLCDLLRQLVQDTRGNSI